MPLPVSKAITEKTLAWAERARERVAQTIQWHGFKIGYASYADIPELLALHAHDYRYSFRRSHAYLQKMVAKSYQDIPQIAAGFLVFRDEMAPRQPLIGMRVFSTESDLGKLESGAIHLHGSKLHPDYQNQGLMGKLSKPVFVRIFEKNPSTKIEVGVAAANRQSITSLRKMGFLFQTSNRFDPAQVPQGLEVPEGVKPGEIENLYYLTKQAFETANYENR